MDPKYSNIFWHQGIKIFKDEMFNTKSGRIRIEHLENDVTKAFLNLFEHCSDNIFQAFLKLINVKEAPGSFEYDFQVTDTKKYRLKNNRIMLSIVSSSSGEKSDPNYDVEQSRPDACLSNKNTAILIEAKTQSPLVLEQIESHIKHYLGSATKQKKITWEEISEKLKLISEKLKPLDRFLVMQFREFLELIGIAEFRGFTTSDFKILGSIGKFTKEDYLDFKRLFYRKTGKFMALLDVATRKELNFKNHGFKLSKVSAGHPGAWSAFYFFDDDADIHVNEYPNINFNFSEAGMGLSFNAEIQSSVKRVISYFKNNPDQFDKIGKNIKDFNLPVYYKFQFAPQNNFLWDLIPGFPKKMGSFKSKDIIAAIDNFENEWKDYRKTILYKMESGSFKHASGRFFNKKEIKFAKQGNPKPNYAIRIEKLYPANQIAECEKKIISFFKKEVMKLKKIAAFVVS